MREGKEETGRDQDEGGKQLAQKFDHHGSPLNPKQLLLRHQAGRQHGPSPNAVGERRHHEAEERPPEAVIQDFGVQGLGL